MTATRRDIDALVKAAEIISSRAKEIASSRSRRIPASTHVVAGSDFVSVVTEGSTAPNAAPFEAAELHPLWAKVGSYRYTHDHWGKQPFFPYMMIAAEQELDKAAVAYADSVYSYAASLGWR